MIKKTTANTTRQPAPKPSSWDNPIIEFKVTLPKAQTVALVGTFNGWDSKRTQLRNEGGGVWRILLPLAAGRHEYRYVVDGQWQEDPAAKEFSPNPFGGRNSVVTVPGEQRRTAQTKMAA